MVLRYADLAAAHPAKCGERLWAPKLAVTSMMATRGIRKQSPEPIAKPLSLMARIERFALPTAWSVRAFREHQLRADPIPVVPGAGWTERVGPYVSNGIAGSAFE